MEKAVRLIIKQFVSHFRIPTLGGGVGFYSFPLPPPSTVYGFLKCLILEKVNYDNLSLSIQGLYQGYMNEVEKYVIFTNAKEGKSDDKTNVMNTAELYKPEWIIHLLPRENHTEFYNRVRDRLMDVKHGKFASGRVLRLGRTEDLVIALDIDEVSLHDGKSNRKYSPNHFIYVDGETYSRYDFRQGFRYRVSVENMPSRGIEKFAGLYATPANEVKEFLQQDVDGYPICPL